jgi:hypothetical protein
MSKIWLTGASMPLARILTAFPERAESLAQQLREKGYTVEFLSPEKAGMLRADLEIDFEICDQKVVLRRAAELANKLHADIAVSPEALPANLAGPESEIYVRENEIVEVPSHIPDPFVETFLAQGERTGQIQNLDRSEHVVSLPPDMLAEPARGNTPEPAIQSDSQLNTEQSRVEPMNVEPVSAEPVQAPTVQPLRGFPVHNMDVPIVPDPERQAEGSFGFETHNFETQNQQVNQTSENAGHVIQPSKAEWLDRAGSRSSSALEAAKQKSASLAASVRRLGADCAEWINVRLAAAQDARQQRQIEAEKQRALAQARAEELEIARDAAAARLQELLRERGGLTDRQPVPPTAGPVPAYRQDGPQVAPRLNQAANATFFEKISTGFAKFKDIALTRKYGQQWEAVLMGVAAACALFVVGVAVNSFRPHAAISNSIAQPSSKPSSLAAPASARATSGGDTSQGATSPNQPYGGVTVQGGSPGVTLLPAPAKAGTSQANPAQVANNKPSPRESDVTVRHFASKPSPRGGGIANDVTIRHFNQQPKPAAHNTTASGVKRFSDLD